MLHREHLVRVGVGQEDVDLAGAVGQRNARLAGAVEVGRGDAAAAGRVGLVVRVRHLRDLPEVTLAIEKNEIDVLHR